MDSVEINKQVEEKAEKIYFDTISYLDGARRKRKATLVCVAALCMSFFVSGLDGNYYFGVISMPKDVMFTVSFMLLLLFFGSVTYMYLQGGIFLTDFYKNAELDRQKKLNSLKEARESSDEKGELRAALTRLEKRLDEAFVGDRAAVVKEISESVKKEAGEEVWKDIKAVGAEKVRVDARADDIEVEFDISKSRLLTEIKSLSRRGSVNLALGVVTTVAAILLLATFALDVSRFKTENLTGVSFETLMMTLIFLFVPKISLAVFMQIFAFFFLRLYKSGLADIKYFQNEITNHELKYFGVQVALIDCDKSVIELVVRELVMTERNHVLSQGQTTIELEKHRLEHDASAELMKMLPKLVERKSS